MHIELLGNESTLPDRWDLDEFLIEQEQLYAFEGLFIKFPSHVRISENKEAQKWCLDKIDDNVQILIVKTIYS